MFVSVFLHKIGLILIGFSLPFAFHETRSAIWRFCEDKLHVEIDANRRCLGFDCDDIYTGVGNLLLKVEGQRDYLVGLKNSSQTKFYLLVSSYMILLLLVVVNVPLFSTVFILFTSFYFFPIIMYLNLAGNMKNLFLARLQKFTDPFRLHWAHARTKRDRKRARKPLQRRNRRKNEIDSDIENEEFIPLQNKECQRVLDEEILKHVSSSTSDRDTEEMDEFELRGEFLRRRSEGHSSDYDEDSFLPSYSHVANEMPSLSNFDSMMEPLDDEFHAGLDFRNVTATSAASFNTSNFGIPTHHQQEPQQGNEDDVTSDDITDISDLPDDDTEQEEERKLSSSDNRLFHTSSQKSMEQNYNEEDFEFDVDQEFEFLDRTELADYTDDDE